MSVALLDPTVCRDRDARRFSIAIFELGVIEHRNRRTNLDNVIECLKSVVSITRRRLTSNHQGPLKYTLCVYLYVVIMQFVCDFHVFFFRITIMIIGNNYGQLNIRYIMCFGESYIIFFRSKKKKQKTTLARVCNWMKMYGIMYSARSSLEFVLC